MYIIYLYIIYILFISLVRRFKNSSPTDPPHVCYDLIVICYLLFVMISPVQGCLVGASWHVLRPYCYLLFVICYDCARTGLPRRGEQTCVTTLLLFVICYDCAVAHGKCPPLLKEKNVSRCFAIPPQSRGDSAAIAPPSYANRRFRCFTHRAGSLLPRAETTAASLQ